MSKTKKEDFLEPEIVSCSEEDIIEAEAVQCCFQSRVTG